MVANVVSRWLGTTSLVLLVASIAPAQERGPGRGGLGAGGAAGGGKIALVQTDQVQQEIKLSDDQKAKVEEIAARVREAGPGRGQPGAAQVDREQLRERMQARARMIAEEEKKLDEVLNEDQRKRLDQISLQAVGVRALLREDVASKLDLSDEQQGKLRESLRGQQAGRGAGQRGDAAAAREQRQQTEQQALEVLTAEQKEKWEELKGEPFQFQARRGAGQRGEGGRGQRRGQN